MYCKSILRFLVFARELSRVSFFKGGIKVGHGVRRQNLSLYGFSCFRLWLYSNPHRTVVFQKHVRRDSVPAKCT